MKKILGILLCLAMLLAPTLALAEYDYTSVTAPNIIVIDSNDAAASNPIYERAADQKVFPASTTKVLTCLVALENGDMTQQVTVGAEIQGLFELRHGYTENSSLMGLKEGETVTLADLLYGLMLVSGNEAADAIAVAVSGSIENFVALMNTKAQQLGMTNSHFANPNGVQNDEHYTTARDMAKLTAAALQNNQFRQIVSTATYTVPANSMRTTELVLYNSNLLLTPGNTPEYSGYQYEYCIGVKTGLTSSAGSCLISAAEKDGACAIICSYGDETDSSGKYQRFAAAKGIFEDLFQNTYTTMYGSELNLQTTFQTPISKANAEDLNADGTIDAFVDVSALEIRGLPNELAAVKANTAAITAEVTWVSEEISAPISEGEILGTVTYSYNGKQIFTTQVKAVKTVREIAVMQTDVVDGTSQEGTTSLLTRTDAPVTPQKTSGGISPVIIVLIVVIVLLVVVMVLYIIAEKKRRERERRRRKAAAARARRERERQRLQ